MVMRRSAPGLRRAAFQEFLFLLFFRAIVRPFRIVPLHLHSLFHGQLWQAPDESHQFPAIVAISMLARAAECGHPRKSHAIFNDPKKFAVRKFLCARPAEVRWLRVKSVSHRIFSTAVVSVANGAMIGKMPPRFTLRVRRICYRVRGIARSRRNRQAPRMPRDKRLEPRRIRSSAQAIMQNPFGEHDRGR